MVLSRYEVNEQCFPVVRSAIPGKPGGEYLDDHLSATAIIDCLSSEQSPSLSWIERRDAPALPLALRIHDAKRLRYPGIGANLVEADRECAS